MGAACRARVRVRIRRSIARLASSRSTASTGFRVLTYHSVTEGLVGDRGEMTIQRELLDEQLHRIRSRGWSIIDADGAVGGIGSGGVLPAPAIVLTFDDGFADNHERLLPLLERHGVSATVFVPAAELVAGSWGSPRGAPDRLDLGRAREMLATGRVAFGCHGATHRTLRGLRPETLRTECREAKLRLEDALGREVPLFAYPFGAPDSWDRQVRSAVVDARYRGAFTSLFGANDVGADPFLLRRCRVSWAEDLRSFDALLDGRYDWYRGYQWLRASLPGIARRGYAE